MPRSQRRPTCGSPMRTEVRIGVHTQPGLSRVPKSILLEFDFRNVATNQMGDRSVLEPMKVVPSRDITPGRRKEPMNRG